MSSQKIKAKLCKQNEDDDFIDKRLVEGGGPRLIKCDIKRLRIINSSALDRSAISIYLCLCCVLPLANDSLLQEY